ncbi:MAG: hypothetical protein EOO88_56950, partial [Pedobacter sp.]
MDNPQNQKTGFSGLKRTLAVVGALTVFACLMVFASGKNLEFKPKLVHVQSLKKDSVASVKAFEKVYMVLKSPRCMNCHPAGDIPLQGEDSHLHSM